MAPIYKSVTFAAGLFSAAAVALPAAHGGHHHHDKRALLTIWDTVTEVVTAVVTVTPAAEAIDVSIPTSPSSPEDAAQPPTVNMLNNMAPAPTSSAAAQSTQPAQSPASQSSAAEISMFSRVSSSDPIPSAPQETSSAAQSSAVPVVSSVSSPAAPPLSSAASSSPAVPEVSTPAVSSEPAVTPSTPAVSSEPAVTPSTPAVPSEPAITSSTPAVSSEPAITPSAPAVPSEPAAASSMPAPSAENDAAPVQHDSTPFDGKHVGKLTYYDPEGGFTSCGTTFDGKVENVIALSLAHSGPLSNNNPLCGRKIKATYNGKSAVGTVQDKCQACDLDHIDVSEHMMKELDIVDMAMGVHWEFTIVKVYHYIASMVSLQDQLVEMGFDAERSKIAASKARNISEAIEWLDANADKPLEELE
ncbi:hypothetical protein KEM54_002138, partial [Ascosphaera aggregata]